MRLHSSPWSAILFAAVLLATVHRPAAAVTEGDIVVTDGDSIIAIDAQTSAQRLITTGGELSAPFSVAFEPAGTLLVVDVGGGRSTAASNAAWLL